MRKHVFIFILLASMGLFIASASSSKNYAHMWKEVKQLESNSLPKSSLIIVNQILKSALADKNIEQAIKATIYKNKFETDIDVDSVTNIFSGLESLLSVTNNEVDRALLHTLLAELYSNYYSMNSWTIDQRTNIEGFIPQDIKLWTKNIFQNKVLNHLKQSVLSQNALLSTSIDDYLEILIVDKNTQQVYPTMYDFLMKRAIAISNTLFDNQLTMTLSRELAYNNISLYQLALPVAEFVKLKFSDDNSLATLFYYQKFLKSLSSRNLVDAIVFTEIDRNNYLSNKFPKYKKDYYTSFLETLAKQFAKNDVSVEIIYNQVNNGSSDIVYKNGEMVQDTSVLTQKYNLLTSGIKKYPNYYRIGILKDALQNLTRSYVEISGSAVFYPTDSKKFDIKYQNVSQIEISILDINEKQVFNKSIEIKSGKPYLYSNTDFNFDLDKVGDYRAEIKCKNIDGEINKDSISFKISRITSFSRTNSDNIIEFYVVDRKNGTPINGAEITLYTQSYKNGKYDYIEQDITITNEQGLGYYNMLDKNLNLFYSVKKDDDVSAIQNCQGAYYYYTRDNNITPKDDVHIFTDRGIYRPGQIVYFKAVLNSYDNKNKPIFDINKQIKIGFYNANNQLISEKQLITNEFGSVAGEFVVPKGELNGSYRLSIDGSNTYVRVEEYKRPTFEIVFNKNDRAYTFGDTATISGFVQNFSGIKLQNTVVEYSIVKNSLFRWWNSNSFENIDDGLVTTNDSGYFEIKFRIPQNESEIQYKPFLTPNIFNLNIVATVTDINGETQSNSTDLIVGSVSMVLTANIPDKIERDTQQTIAVTATNLNGEKLQTHGCYTISSVLANDSIDRQIAKGQFNTSDSNEVSSIINNLKSGKYLIVFEANDDKGRLVKIENYFIVYSSEDKKPPIDSNDWLLDNNAVFKDDKPAEIVIGVSAKNVTILYELMKAGSLQSQEQFELSDENKKIVIPYKEVYGDNVTTLFTYIVDEKVYQKQIDIKKESQYQNLTLKWNVFRDRVRPDQKEEWSIVVKDANGNPAVAELLASMYDASLDMLSQTPQWDLQTKITNYTQTYGWLSPNLDEEKYNLVSFNTKNYLYPPLQLTAFNWFDFSFGYSNRVMLRSYAAATPTLLNESAVTKAKFQSLQMESVAIEQKSSTDEPSIQPQIRKNFDETAFFYPQLKTNSNGETLISFTVPGSNTTWNFRALAYDKSLNVGKLNAVIISRKELMVTPNIPSFMRQGDKTSITTKISNLSDKVLSGKVYLEFYNPITNQIISNINISDQTQDFNLDPNSSTEASWFFHVPDNIDVLGCRIVADSKSFSDGEQHAIAILPNRTLVTEVMNLDMFENGTKKFTFDRLMNNESRSLSNYRLILEYANNPAWYAIQALPEIANPTNEDVVSWFASYYTNTLSETIIKQYPNVSAAITSWTNGGGNENSFLSQLQKNEELKMVLLEETPWVLEAKNETEQMKQLSLLFNLNNTSSKAQAAIAKLADLQNIDGGWSWFKGMASSRNITLYVLYGFSELINLQAVEYSSEIKQMQINALNYLDNQVITDFSKSDWNKLKSIPTSLLEFMYVRSAYRDIPINKEAREIERAATHIIQNNWQTLNDYEKSLLIVLAKRNGNTQLMNKLINSLREHATVSDNLGMYWANNRSTAFMSQSPVSVHTFIMEAFKEAGADEKVMNEMKKWLLSQKQTQRWESTDATLDAINALLSTGSNWFTLTDDNAKIYVGNKLLSTNVKDKAIGYILQSWSENEIIPNMGNIKIEKSSTYPSWGAMYWQYFQDIDKISSNNSQNLNIDKQYFIEKDRSLYPITASSMLKVGDKVTVRIVVKTNIDLDFVQIKDMRPSCFQPVSQLSEYRYMNNVGYYQSQKDASTSLFFDVLPKGTYVFEYPVYVNRAGTYLSGNTTIQCIYAPEFVANTSGQIVQVK